MFVTGNERTNERTNNEKAQRKNQKHVETDKRAWQVTRHRPSFSLHSHIELLLLLRNRPKRPVSCSSSRESCGTTTSYTTSWCCAAVTPLASLRVLLKWQMRPSPNAHTLQAQGPPTYMNITSGFSNLINMTMHPHAHRWSRTLSKAEHHTRCACSCNNKPTSTVHAPARPVRAPGAHSQASHPRPTHPSLAAEPDASPTGACLRL